MTYSNPASEAAEEQVRLRCQQAWGMEIRPMPYLSPIDWYATDGSRLNAWIELKVRHHGSQEFPTVALSARKYFALTFASLAFGKPALFVAAFDDGVRWINAASIDASRHFMLRTAADAVAARDYEPAIEIHIQSMRPIGG